MTGSFAARMPFAAGEQKLPPYLVGLILFFFYFFVLLVFFIGQVGDSLYPRVDPPGQS